jgi:hypothetical protein
MASWVLVDGLSRLLLGVIAFIAVSLLIDWSFQMDRPQRIVMLALAVGAAGVLAYRRLWKPLAMQPTDDALVLQVEEQHPDLRESLISAVQFSRQAEHAEGVSLAMVRATVDLGVQAAERVEFGQVLHRQRFLINSLLLAAAVLVLGGTAAAGFVSQTVSIWFNRNVLLGDREWPQDVHFQIVGAVDNVLTMPRGDDWPLEVLVTDDSRRLPDEAWLEVQGTRRRQRMDSLDGGRKFHTDLTGIADDLVFRVVEARAYSAWTSVRLIDRPAVVSLELRVTPPSYTGQPAELLPPGGGPYKLLSGSTLSIRGQATKPLSSATLTLGQAVMPMQITGGTGLALDLAAGQVKDGDYVIDLLDTERLWLPGHEDLQPLASREPATFRLRTGPDREPQVQAKLTGISNLVTPRALIPISGRVTDDFGIADLRLQRRWRGEKDEADTTGTDHLHGSVDLPARIADFESVLDLEPLSVPTAVSLSFFVEADDNNTVSGPGVGRSTVFLVRVVTEEELRAALLAREREQRVEFEKRIKVQDELKTDCEALLAGVRSSADLADEQRAQLARLQKRQKSVGDDLARIARRFEDIVVEVRQNRIEEEKGPVQTRLSEKIIVPLWSVANTDVSAVTDALERAARQAAQASQRNASLAQAAAAQEQVLAKMREILANLEQAEGFQEAVNLLLEVQRAQEDVRQMTDKEKQEAIRRLLEEAEKK